MEVMTGLGGVVLGIFVSYFFYRRSLQPSALLTRISTRHLLNQKDLPKGVTISLDGIALPNLYRCRVLIWNAGKTTLIGSDISISDPLRLKLVDGVQWISQETTDQSSPRNNFSVTERDGDKLVKFEILEPGDELQFSFLFVATGESEKNWRRAPLRHPGRYRTMGVSEDELFDGPSMPAAELIGSLKGIRKINHIEVDVVRATLKTFFQPVVGIVLALWGIALFLLLFASAIYGTYEWLRMFFIDNLSPWQIDFGRYPAVLVALWFWGIFALATVFIIVSNWIDKPNNPPSNRE